MREWWKKVRHETPTDSKQLLILPNMRVIPKVIKVASRLALLSRNVKMRIGIKKWPPMM